MTTHIEYINPKGACPAQGLYSHVTRVPSGPLYFVAGQLAVAADGSVAGVGDFAVQFDAIFGNMGNVLSGLGLDFNDVVRFNTFLVDDRHIEQFMVRRAKLFPKLFKTSAYPPNTLLIVKRLVKPEFLLEIEAVVHGRS